MFLSGLSIAVKKEDKINVNLKIVHNGKEEFTLENVSYL